MSYVTVAICNTQAVSNMHDLQGICSISAFTWMGKHFIKYFFMFFVLYSWWQRDSNWKPFIYHTSMIVTKRLGLNDDNLNIKVKSIPKRRMFMLSINTNLTDNEPSPGYLRGERCQKSFRESVYDNVSTTASSVYTKPLDRQATYCYVATMSFGEFHWCMN
jgi:hypothetical protein